MNSGVHMPARRARQIMRLPEPVMRFRLYPGSRRRSYIEALIFRTSRELQSARSYFWPKRRKVEVWAFFHERDEWCSVEPRRIGDLCLCLDSVSHLNVGHELWHAVEWWAQRLHLNPREIFTWNTAAHERMAEAIGQMAEQFWERFESRS